MDFLLETLKDCILIKQRTVNEFNLDFKSIGIAFSPDYQQVVRANFSNTDKRTFNL